MATPERQRQALIDLVELAQGDLRAALDLLRAMSPVEARDALMEILPALGMTYGDGAAALAAEWFDEARAQAEARGSFRAAQSAPQTRGRWEALTRWGVDPLFHEGEPDWAAALSLLAGGLQRSISDRHRLTIVENSIRDPQAAGWRRVGVGDNCSFCSMLIGRGFVYTEASVTFKSHDRCRCVAAPSWSPNVRKMIGVPFEASKKWRTEEQKEANRRRVRNYLKDQG